jgi:hypothetical protein
MAEMRLLSDEANELVLLELLVDSEEVDVSPDSSVLELWILDINMGA